MDHVLARVADTIESAARSILLPAWRTEVGAERAPDGRLVTQADRTLEAELGRQLQMIHNIPVFGQEMISDRPSLLWQLSSVEDGWIVDPLDGTRQFLEGSDTFGCMVALFLKGRLQAAWIAHPAREGMIVAGPDGCLLDDTPVRIAKAPIWWRVLAQGRNFPPRVQETLAKATRAHFEVRPMINSSFALRRLLEGTADALLTSHVTPWDSAATVFAWRQAGGTVQRLDQDTWKVYDVQGALLFAPNAECIPELHQRLVEGYGGVVDSSFAPGTSKPGG